jgi:hypothetical protein
LAADHEVASVATVTTVTGVLGIPDIKAMIPTPKVTGRGSRERATVP